MLKLTYHRMSDEFQTVTVLGDPNGIRDLYWQLTRNYSATDGTAIGKVVVSTLDGEDCTTTILRNPFASWSALSRVY